MDINKYPNLKRIVYNDFNKLNVNLFNCVREYDKFYGVIKDYKSQNRDIFVKFQKEIFDENFKVNLNSPDFQTAAKYVYILSQVWSGTNPEKGGFINLKGKYKSKFDSFKDKLQNKKWQNLFDRITNVESLDFEDVIKKYDSKKSYFYCDPPYYKTEKYYANHSFGIETHERLANSLKGIKGKFSLSYYQFDLLKEWFPEDSYLWKSRDFHKASMAKSGKAQTRGTEMLIMNYNVVKKKELESINEWKDI
jgi:DNA adenine methylase